MTLTFDLNVNRDHVLVKNYLPTKFEASGANLSWVISCTRWSRRAWPLTLTFDLNINRDQDYLPTKFEASRAKRSWVISCTRCGRLTWPLTLTFDLLTWLSIGIIYSSWSIYLPSLKFMRWGVVELLDAQVVLGGYRRNNRHMQSHMPLPSFKGGHKHLFQKKVKSIMFSIIWINLTEEQFSVLKFCWNAHVGYQQGMLTPLDTWFRPFLGLTCSLIFPNLMWLSTFRFYFQYAPSLRLFFCSLYQINSVNKLALLTISWPWYVNNVSSLCSQPTHLCVITIICYMAR